MIMRPGFSQPEKEVTHLEESRGYRVLWCWDGDPEISRPDEQIQKEYRCVVHVLVSARTPVFPGCGYSGSLEAVTLNAARRAQSLQSCRLSATVDRGLPGSSVCGILKPRNTRWVAISASVDVSDGWNESPPSQANSLPMSHEEALKLWNHV